MRLFALYSLVLGMLLSVAASAVANSISGKITNPKKCTRVQALLRKGPGVKFPCVPKVFPAKYDAKTGEFRAGNLPEGEYDLRVLVPGGWVDGADFRLEEDDGNDPFSKEDEKMLREYIEKYPDRFSDILRPIHIRGNGRYAKVLVEKIRARQFHSGAKGEITWRVEVWLFEKQTGAWVRPQRSVTVVGRLRVFNTASRHYRRGNKMHAMAGEFHRQVWLFSLEMGGFEVEEDEPVEGLSITVPEATMAHGKVAGSVKKQIEEWREKHPEPYLE